MITWRFYDPATGVMLRRKFIGSASQLAANTPPGYAAIRVDLDPLSQRVAVELPPDEDGSLQVVDYQPPAPPDDQWQTWAWDAETKRWESSPTLAAVKSDRRQAMAAAYEAARQAGVTVGTKVAPTTPDAWTRYLVIRQMAAEAGWVDVPIPLVDGTFELLTVTKAQALWAALKTLERDTLARLRDRVEAINAAATADAVAAVVW